MSHEETQQNILGNGIVLPTKPEAFVTNHEYLLE